MENLLNPHDKQYMKMAMLKHEETFKQQVYELHRLYQVQKILMKNMEVNKGNNVNSGLGTFRRANRPENFPGGGESGGNNIEIMDESEIVLTLGPSCYGGGDLMSEKKKKKKSSSPEMIDGSFNSDRRSFSSSSPGSSNNINNDLEEQVRQEILIKHGKQKQKQPWLQALTLNVI